MKLPPDFHNDTGLNGLVDSSSDPQKWKTTTTEKKHHARKGSVQQKSFNDNYTKFVEKYLC